MKRIKRPSISEGLINGQSGVVERHKKKSPSNGEGL